MTTKLLALAASTRADSVNKKLMAIAAAEAKNAGAEVTMLDYANYEAPNVHTQTKDLPPAMKQLGDLLLAHDGMMIATPEYNWSIPGSLKNIIDWLSMDARAPLNGRTALLMAATPSVRGGVSALQQTRVPLEVLGVWVYPKVIGVGVAHTQIQGDTLVNEKDQKFLVSTVTDFVNATNKLRG